MHRLNYLLLILIIAGITKVSGQAKKAQPNILWITCEDMSPHLGSYGDSQVKTPYLDKLASEGIRYTNAFATAGVCAPSRSAIITGMYQQSIGTQHMRTGKISANKDAYPPDYIGYSAVVPEHVKCFPEYLRANGYYCSNNSKEDYQFEAPPTAWDESSNTAHWRNRKKKEQPFFAVFNLMVTHESQVWARAGEPLLVDPKDVQVPPYYPDVPEVRMDMARHLSNVMVMDQQAGEILKQLEDDGLSNNTIVFFFSDHGDGLPFVKREIYDRGIRVPLIIRFGEHWQTANTTGPANGVVNDQLISLVDLAPTMLSLTGCKIPERMQGQAFLGPAKAAPRKYVFAARDRMDSEYDRVRSIRDEKFLYLRNYMPEKPYYQNIAYRLQQPMMKVILDMKANGSLNEQQMLWFRPTKPPEELYDCTADPFQFKDLASDPAYAKQVARLRRAYDGWITGVGDLSDEPESQMLKSWWGGKDEAPKTAAPTMAHNGSGVTLSSATGGASIGYKFKWADAWSVYVSPVQTNGRDSLYSIAQRIGYAKSDVVKTPLGRR
ncbi:MAG TPA: sulfatase [Chryseolinea sp.]